MFTDYIDLQFKEYNKAKSFFIKNPNRLISIERFVFNEIWHFIDLHLPEIKRDHNEASYGTIAPLVTFALKPVYSMQMVDGNNCGQPLHKIKVASIPNGLLLTQNPNYLKQYSHLFFPGKDDKSKDPRKQRARVSFDLLKEIDDWRVREIEF